MESNMTNERKSLIVTGTTGKQGGALISALLVTPSQPFDIYALTRDPQSAGAKALLRNPRFTSSKEISIIQHDCRESL